MDDTNPEPRVWPDQHSFRHSNLETTPRYDDALLIESDMSYAEASRYAAIQNAAQYSGDCAPDLGRDSLQSFGETQQSSSHQSYQQPGHIKKDKKRSRQPQYTAEDWNSHRLRLKKLYLTDDESLDTTMTEMKKFGFEPSKKLYKEKFNQWKWFKNLPQETALWMNETYKQRNRPTTFFYGVQEWPLERIQNVAKRAKTTHDITTLQNMRTPKDLSVFTPAACESSPAARRHHAGALPDLGSPVSQTKDDSTSSPPFCKLLQFDWNGHKVEGIRSLAHEARQLHLKGDTLNAEKQLREALGKFQAVLCPTHVETVAVAYNLAALYAEQDRFNDVDVVVDGILEKHVQRWGLFHHATIAQFVRIIGLLGSWGRRDEAKALSDRLESYLSPETVVRPSGDPESWNTARTPVAPDTEHITRTNNLNSHQNRFIAPPTATELPALEELFNRLIEDHNRTPDRFNPQILLTFCAIYERCRLADTNEGAGSILDRVRRFVDTILSTRSNMTAPILNACADVAKFYILDDIQAGEDMFQKVAYVAEVTLPADDLAVMQLSIRIGLIYQGHNLWRMAKPWFERALSTSVAVNGLTSAATKKIEQALEKQHYAESLLDSWSN